MIIPELSSSRFSIEIDVLEWIFQSYTTRAYLVDLFHLHPKQNSGQDSIEGSCTVPMNRSDGSY